MIKHQQWPPPEGWTEVVITWERMLREYNAMAVLSWVDKHPGGLYHLHGYQATLGWAFRFQDPKDAMMFSLKWGTE